MEKVLKILLIVLIMILVIVVGFGGIYVKNNAFYKNIIPGYELDENLEGYTISTFKVDDSTETVYYDAEGKEIDEAPSDGSEFTSEEKNVNSDEDKTSENYELTKTILINRLKTLKVSDYEVRVDKENGNIYIALPEDENTSTTLSELIKGGEFEIRDTDSEEVLLNNDDIKEAKVMYYTSTSGINVYLNIEFTKSGTKKLKQVSQDYATISDEDTTEESNDSEESEENTETEETEDSELEENEETDDDEDETSEQKTITMYIDDSEFLSTSFDEPIEDGIITITLGNASTDTDTVSEYIKSAQYYAMLLSNKKLPLTYTQESSEYMQSIYANDMYAYIALGILACIAILSLLYMIIRYKTNGLMIALVYIATIALYIILIRLTEVKIGIEIPIIGFVLLTAINYINCKILNSIDKEDTREERRLKLKEVYIKLIDIAVILLIPAVVLSYSSYSKLSIIGMNLFWGILTIIVMNLIFTRTAFLIKTKKD
jgi:preprotein translocase subunit SecD